jgi:hypothetical protein
MPVVHCKCAQKGLCGLCTDKSVQELEVSRRETVILSLFVRYPHWWKIMNLCGCFCLFLLVFACFCLFLLVFACFCLFLLVFACFCFCFCFNFLSFSSFRFLSVKLEELKSKINFDEIDRLIRTHSAPVTICVCVEILSTFISSKMILIFSNPKIPLLMPNVTPGPRKTNLAHSHHLKRKHPHPHP